MPIRAISGKFWHGAIFSNFHQNHGFNEIRVYLGAYGSLNTNRGHFGNFWHGAIFSLFPKKHGFSEIKV